MENSIIKNQSLAEKKAVDYLTNQISQGKWQNGERIPPAIDLARAAGVSRPAMLTAALILKSQGALAGVPHGPLRIPGNGPTTNRPSNPIWQIKRKIIEEELLTGSLAIDGAMPSIKELSARYGSCFVTMRKILQAMVADGMLMMKARTYHVVHPSLRTGDQVYFLTPTTTAPPRSALNPAEYRVANTLERECARRKLKLQTIEFDYSDDSFLSTDITRAPGTTLGYVVDVWWAEYPRLRDWYANLIDRLAKTKKPLALVDEVGDFPLPSHQIANQDIQTFKTSDRHAGIMMAQLFRQLGHTSAIFISASQGQLWSQQRYAGVSQIFPGTGKDQHLFVCGSDSSASLSWFLFLFSGLSDGMLRKILSIGRTPPQVEDEFAAYTAFQKTCDTSVFTAEDIKAIQHDGALLRDLIRRDPGPDVFILAGRAIIDNLNTRVGTVLYRPLFQTALANKTSRAWICANDITALSAIEFLREKKIAVPRDISVAGFDNLPAQGLKNQLTSYDFNTQGLVFRALEFLIRPPRPRSGWHHVPIEIEGMIMERESTGRPSSR